MTKIKYDPKAPNLVADSEGFIVGIVTGWNPIGLGECIVQYFDGSADSAYATELNFPNGRKEAYGWLNQREPW
jgi:hypothetical protein